jgi:hypothetical protein
MQKLKDYSQYTLWELGYFRNTYFKGRSNKKLEKEYKKRVLEQKLNHFYMETLEFTEHIIRDIFKQKLDSKQTKEVTQEIYNKLVKVWKI